MNINWVFPVCQLPLWWERRMSCLNCCCLLGWVSLSCENLIGAVCEYHRQPWGRGSHITRAGAHAGLCELSQRLPVLPPSQESLVWGKFFVPSFFLSCFPPPSSFPYCLSFLTLGTEPRASLMLRQELYHWAVSQPETTPVTKGKVCVCVWGECWRFPRRRILDAQFIWGQGTACQGRKCPSLGRTLA